MGEIPVVREKDLSCSPSNEAGGITFVLAILSVWRLLTDIAPYHKTRKVSYFWTPIWTSCLDSAKPPLNMKPRPRRSKNLPNKVHRGSSYPQSGGLANKRPPCVWTLCMQNIDWVHRTSVICRI
jgi:hypothetical protein